MPQLVWAIVGMWLHPAIWPADSMVERRRRVAALTVVVTAAGWLTAHAVLELTGAVPRALAHSWILTVCDTMTFLGFLLALPIPRLRSIVQLAVLAARRIAVPVALGAGVVVAVHRDLAVPAVVKLAVVAAWWLALMLIAGQVIRTVADVDLAAVAVPSPRRLRLGLWTTAAGLAGSGLTILMPALAGTGDLAGVLGGCTVLALAAAVNGTVRDLAEVRTV
ncbi:hypothetical protein JOF29_006958 [Kribbella aluminosa]|uniref:Uncharacterized protein n=1 Tax=Kribbella aluminosa TaxID=416017 RepID=A0ABS4UW18_9ACTN|nr:hypothetical protein [Kribbella aluminosa]MBP2355848.1 hypothetical protein [Kribbella aluminosa]